MRILVIGGMHGNELLGPAVVKLFLQNPVKSVDVVLANELALDANSRYVVQDLNRSFPGDSKSKDYEPLRAAQLLEMAKNYDLVLDFHNTYCSDNDCGFVGQSTSKLPYMAAFQFGIRRMIVADYECINKYADNCLSIEISLDSEQNKPELWYERIAILSRLDQIDADINALEKYRFVYRMTLKDKEGFNLPNKKLRAFVPLEKGLAEKMGVESPAYPIFIADKFTPYYYGGLLRKL